MSDKFNDLVRLLRELFQLDQPDLDFGLYRIMHAKSGEVTQFLEEDLLPQVKKAFEQYQPADKAAIKKKLDQAVAAAESLSVDPDTNEKVLQLRSELAEGADLEAMENEVYDHLYTFFRRYYSEGDFLAKRVYKPGVYAVPYEGEEVVLHWANKDQYYIKTSEYLRDYAFRLKPDAGGDPMRVHFRLVAAAEGEHGNNKAAEGKDRVFVLAPAGESGHDFLSVETVEGREELVIGFEYRAATMDDWTEEAKAQATAAAKKKPPKQKDLINIAVKAVLATTGDAFDGWIGELVKPHTKVNGETAEYSRLQGHLSRYCARHTFDYFIHKDLGGFLRRELDFYIKNEVMHLDDIQNEDAPKVEQYLSKIKVIRTIAGKVIDFLHQLEEFQRHLWLKRKFAHSVSYLVTLDRVPNSLYETVAANDAQVEEWVERLGIDSVEADLTRPGFSRPLTTEFLRHHQYLPVNTAHFDDVFVASLLDSIDSIEDSLTGLLVDSDNLQGLQLLSRSLRGQVRFIYIDPPYNTGGDGFMFKDAYQHSTWLTMIEDRLALCPSLLDQCGLIYCSIDENERRHLEAALQNVFGWHNRVDELIWVQNSNKNQSPTYSTVHEYIEVFANDLREVKRNYRLLREPKPGYADVIDLVDSLNSEFPPIADIEAALAKLYKEHKTTSKKDIAAGLTAEDEWKGIYSYKNAEYRDDDGAFVSADRARERNARIWVWREDNPSMPQVKEDSQKAEFRDPESPTFRFYKPKHPVTGKPCPPPKTGWRWPYKRHGNQTRCFVELADDNRIAWGEDEKKIPQTKRFLHEVETNVAKSVVIDFTDGEKELANLFGRSRAFSNPKPSTLIQRLCSQTAAEGRYCIDFFAGSGTTAQGVLALNREDQGNRKFVLIECGDHFDEILLPRIQKLICCGDWSDGRPQSLDHGLSAFVKVLRLETYEDSVGNLLMERDKTHEQLLTQSEASSLKEQYILRYQLDVESRGSPSLLDITAFHSPLEYTLRLRAPGGDESQAVAVDLLETFNWLLGLRVIHIGIPRPFNAKLIRDKEGRLATEGRIKEHPDGPWWFRTVTGTTPDGKRALIIWRKRPGGDDPEGIEQDNAVLDAWFRTQGYSTTDSEFDIVWVNGDNNLANLRQDDTPDDGLGETGWKVRIIEQDFHRLMFDTSDVPGAARDG